MVLQLHHPLLIRKKLKLPTIMTLLHRLTRLLNHPQDRLKTLSMSINFKINFNLVQKCMTIRNFKTYSTKRKNLHDSNQLVNDADKSDMINPSVILPSVCLFTVRYANILENDNRCIADTLTFPLSHFEECEGTYRMMIRTRWLEDPDYPHSVNLGYIVGNDV